MMAPVPMGAYCHRGLAARTANPTRLFRRRMKKGRFRAPWSWS